MKKHYYVVGTIEGDVLILAGLSVFLKDLSQDNVTHLIIPTYSRVKERTNKYYKYFDEVILIKSNNFQRNFIKGLSNIYRSYSQLSRLKVPNESIFIMFDIYSFAELLIYSYIKFNRRKQLKYYTISAFESKESKNDKLKLLLKGTLIKSFYSLILTQRLFRQYNIKGTEDSAINIFKAECDYQLSIENSHYRNECKNAEEGLIYPVNFLTQKRREIVTKENNLENNSAILFLDSSLESWCENYWEMAISLIQHLKNLDLNVHLKDHPNCTSKIEEKINMKTSNYELLPNQIPAEELFIVNSNKITAVVSHGSTSLITASWLGIPAINVSEYFGFPDELQIKHLNFLNLGRNIKHISKIECINREFLSSIKKESANYFNKEKISNWEKVFNHQN